MPFYDKTKPPYSDVSEVGLGLSLLKTQNGTSCPGDMALDNNILWPITIASNSLSSTERRYSNIEREVSGILHGLENSITTVFQDMNV